MKIINVLCAITFVLFQIRWDQTKLLYYLNYVDNTDKTAPCVHQNDVLKEINDSILCRPRKSF